MKKISSQIPSVFKKSIKSLKPFNSNPKLILVVGATGGGTTLTSSLIDQYFQIDSITHESQLAFNSDSNFKATFPRLYKSFEDYRFELENKFKRANLNQFKKEIIKVYKNRSGFSLKVNTIVDKSPNYHFYRIDYYLKTFKDVNVVVIFRDPKENVEGMLRKWELFRSAGINKISEFWKDSFENILKYEQKLNGNIIFVDLNDLKKNPKGFFKTIESNFKLNKRKKLKKYGDKSNLKGKALRNVNNGLIVLDNTKQKLDLSSMDQKIIENICYETYKKLQDRKLKL